MAKNQKSTTSVVFFGAPAFAVKVLEALRQDEQLGVKAVITQPDRPCGRGQACTPCAVKEYAQSHGYPVLQPERLVSEHVVTELRSLQADVFVVAAYGLLLPQAILDIPPLGCLNVHASLLPRHRGASPIQAALLQGDKATGITIMRMVKDLDAGPILLQRALAIGLDDTAQTLHDQLADLGGRLIVQALQGYRSGSLAFIEQDHSLATYAPKLTKEDGRINWDRPAMDVHNHVRAMHPWPGAFFTLQGQDAAPRKVAVHPGSIGEVLPQGTPPGTFLGMQSKGLAMACRDRAYLVRRLHPAHARPMDAQAFFCGYLQRLATGDNICPPLPDGEQQRT